MIEQKNEISNSKRNTDKIKDTGHAKNNINNKLCTNTNNIIMNYLFLIFFINKIIILIIFLFVLANNIKPFNNICENGFFLPKNDQTKCIKCSLEGCMDCIRSKLNNTCIKCI